MTKEPTAGSGRRLAGKVAIITGAARGQGAWEAEAFVREGASVVLTDILAGEGAETAGRIDSSGTRTLFIEHDVRDEDRWNAVVAQSVEAFGRVDVLVNNAGLGGLHSLEDMTLDQWNHMLGTGVTSQFLGTRAIVPELRRNGGGSIINISSLTAMVAGRDPAHAAAKGAIRSMTKTLAAYLGPDGIRVNSVHPGFMDTPMLDQARAQALEQTGEDQSQAILDTIPMRRLGQPRDVGGTVLFLASDESDWITGCEFIVDGGSLIRNMFPMIRPAA